MSNLLVLPVVVLMAIVIVVPVVWFLLWLDERAEDYHDRRRVG